MDFYNITKPELIEYIRSHGERANLSAQKATLVNQAKRIQERIHVGIEEKKRHMRSMEDSVSSPPPPPSLMKSPKLIGAIIAHTIIFLIVGLAVVMLAQSIVGAIGL